MTPAAGFFPEADAGAKTVELNLEPGNHGSMFDEQWTEVVDRFFGSLLS